MKLVNYEVVELPKNGVRHSLGDKLGLVTISEALADSYTDEIARECVKHELPYFKKKEGEVKKSVAKVSAEPKVAPTKKPVAKAKNPGVDAEPVATA